MEIIIRQEMPADYRETENVTREAFFNQYSPGCAEHYLLHIMRNAQAFVPHLDLVAIHDGRIVGNIAFAKGTLQGDDGHAYEVLSLGPISVLPPFQGRGIGGRLIACAKERARQMGYRAMFLCGDPAYYVRQGFRPAKEFGIRTADGMYAAALQACELYEGALCGLSGRYVEDPIYEVDIQAVEAFDQAFPPMEKQSGVKMQQRFLKIASMREAAREPYTK